MMSLTCAYFRPSLLDRQTSQTKQTRYPNGKLATPAGSLCELLYVVFYVLTRGVDDGIISFFCEKLQLIDSWPSLPPVIALWSPKIAAKGQYL